ncbi:hypothetical protein [Sphingomonas sp.]|uniref:hypothetical protein n=1 Tax=Sphingomonas sp. TaxID=28214 RepID=UPI001B0B211B|nr:hypothetical protein [Sphingomonas sp.]MBO9712836.1 hypothetical protein [Sphingomonas sp.]
MDLNYLYSRHQVSLMLAKRAASPEARWAHRAMARAYAQRIRLVQEAVGITDSTPLVA